jgi:hypothetical protein
MTDSTKAQSDLEPPRKRLREIESQAENAREREKQKGIASIKAEYAVHLQVKSFSDSKQIPTSQSSKA